MSALTRNRVYRSIIRHGFPDTNRNRSLRVFTNFFLHIHPVKVRRRAIAFTQTFYLGGLAGATFFILVVTGIFLMFYYHPSVPRLGGYGKFLLLGGHQVNENALLRFYVLHCVVLPLSLVTVLAVHIWRVRKDGGLYLEGDASPAHGPAPGDEG